MTNSLNDLDAKQVAVLLNQKRSLYEQMIASNHKFEDVKPVFTEIKVLEQYLDQLQQTRASFLRSEKD